jgi:hypothetical protein
MTTINNAINNETPNVAQYSFLYSGGSAAPVAGVALAAGQIAVGTGSAPVAQTLQNVSTWVDEASSSVNMAINTGYIADDSGSLVTLTLPATAAIGSVIEIVGKSADGWKVVYTTSQQILFGSSSSTVTTGNVASTSATDCIRMVCTTTNNIWTINGAIGNITVA